MNLDHETASKVRNMNRNASMVWRQLRKELSNLIRVSKLRPARLRSQRTRRVRADHAAGRAIVRQGGGETVADAGCRVGRLTHSGVQRGTLLLDVSLRGRLL